MPLLRWGENKAFSFTAPGAIKVSEFIEERTPVQYGDTKVAEISAVVDVYKLAVKYLSRTNATCKSFCWLLSDGGRIIYGQARHPRSCLVVNALSSPSAPHQDVGGRDLLEYVADRCISSGASELAYAKFDDGDRSEQLVAFMPVILGGQRYALVIGSPKADISVPIASHERVTYALLIALAILYFATGYVAYRGEYARLQHEQERRAAAEKASKAKGEFLTRMSHELRTPMNGIIGMTELAIACDNDVERKRFLQVAKECGNSLLTVVNDILDMSKIEAGKLDLCHIPFNLPDCVASTLMSLSPMARKRQLALRWEIDSGAPSLLTGDPGRLRQVINNLVGNSLKFTERGEVILRVWQEDQDRDKVFLHFCVRDTGPGLSGDDQLRVFEAFDQGSRGGTGREEGSGLGLTIARQLVGLMGGKAWVESQLGQGSKFHFTARFALCKDSPAIDGSPLPDLKGVRTLVVCGVSQMMQRLAGSLSSWGAVVTQATGEGESLAMLAEAFAKGFPFALVLAEASEPSLDVFAFAEKMRRMDGSDNLALAGLFPAGLRGDANLCLQLGIDSYLVLPIRNDQLHMALRLSLWQVRRKIKSIVTKHNSQVGCRRLNVLLAEDNPVIQEATSLLLTQWGHSVTVVGSGEEALEELSKQNFDLILMDLQMPGMSGIETAAAIRRRECESGNHAYIIAVTGYATEFDRRRCLDAGMDDYISKPVSPDHLRQMVQRQASLAAPCVIDAHMPSKEAPSNAGSEKVWNPDSALNFAGGSQAALDRVIQSFLADLEAVLPAARSAVVAGDKQAIGRFAHRLIGSLGMLRAQRARNAAQRLEKWIADDESKKIIQCFEQLDSELCILQKELTPKEIIK